MSPLRIGLVGCGNISGIYFQNLNSYKSTRVVACADILPKRAEEAAAKQTGVEPMTVENLIASPEVDLVLNLTVPHSHAAIALAAVDAGKHVYNEKPLTIRREEAKLLLDKAKEKGLRVGCAPDTFMGAGLQTCRELIEQGVIGEPVAAHAFMLGHGPEGWHPSPEFFYQVGGGPMFDMGPYYLTAYVHLMGPVKRVSGSVRTTFPQRTITSEPLAGKVMEVEVATHIAGILDFQKGPIGEITTSFDVWHSKLPCITIYGSEGSMLVPDPNSFSGEIWVQGAKAKDWELNKISRPFAENSRGLGILDIAHAIRDNRPHRASGELAYHVLDLMYSFHDSSEQERHVYIESTVEQPAPLGPDEFKEELA